MPQNSMSRSHIFLIELIIATLFFAFACGVTVQVFGKAHDLAERSTSLNGALIATQTMAETDKATAFADIVDARLIVYFDADWAVAEAEAADYAITTDIAFDARAAGTMVTRTYNVTINGNKDPAAIVYSLTSKTYYSGEYLDQGTLRTEDAASSDDTAN